VKRDRLGKGLSALLGDYLQEEGTAPASAGAPDAPKAQTRALAVAAIGPNPYQPRRDFADAELMELAASIKENGLLQPIVVRPAPNGAATKWEVVAGERRWRAIMKLGWTEIPAVVRDVDDRTLLVLALVENLQRAQLSALEEAEGYQRLTDEFSLSHQQVADVVGKERSTVANAVRLLGLPHSVRQLMRDGSLSAGHARALLGLGSDHRIAEAARQAIAEEWSVREVEAYVKRLRHPAKRSASREKSRDFGERVLEEELQRIFGTEVRIRRGRGTRGKVEIPFFGHDDFERIFELLARRTASDVLS
jgi:ParB family chromosome partitioning protein